MQQQHVARARSYHAYTRQRAARPVVGTKTAPARTAPSLRATGHIVQRGRSVYGRATPEGDDKQVDAEMQALDEDEYREIFDPSNQVPGSYRDAMSSKTELGNAVREACDELDALRGLETDVIQQAEELLKGIGMKGSLFDVGEEQTNEEK